MDSGSRGATKILKDEAKIKAEKEKIEKEIIALGGKPITQLDK